MYQSNDLSPAPRQRQYLVPATSDGGFGSAVSAGVGFLFVIWAVFLVDTTVFGGALTQFGLRPRDPSGWYGIFLAPLLHANLAHVMSNSVAGALFAALIAFTSKRLFWQVTFIVTVIAGGLTWLIGGVDTVHIGASGLVYGWLSFLIVRGFVNRSIVQSILGIILATTYSGLIWGVIPTQAAVSWEMHFFGALGGILAAVWLKRGRQRVPSNQTIQRV